MTSSTNTQEGAVAGGSSQDMDPGPSKIQWRSRYDPRPVDLKEKFTDQFKQDDDVYVNGARGCSGPFKVDVVLGNGSYKLRGQKGEKMKKIYEEDDLSRLPRTIS